MSTKISAAYDQLLTNVQSVLSGHARLPNPYKLEENASIFLKKGFGIGFGGGSNTNRQLACATQSLSRTMFIAITREYFAKENDASGKATTEKQILEDALLVIKSLNQDIDLSSSVFDAKWVSDTGIQYVQTERDNFMSTTIEVLMEYFENLT